jgi:murein DD-endopeptidase MepM/ murein hydrolase activator NlpD
MSGLALPTAAAVTLMFIATGAAVATAPKTQAVAFSPNATAVTTAQPVAVDPAIILAAREKGVEQTLAAVREDVAARANRTALVAAGVARSSQRKNLAARAQQARVVQTQQAQQARARQVQRVQAVEAKRAAAAHGWQLPIKSYTVTSGFGFRWGRLHAGEDFGAPTGTDLVSMSTGTVDFAGQESGYGNIVKIRYWDGTVSYFGHMSRISVNTGESLEPGQSVGAVGNTGHSTGPHLHLEMHPNGGGAVNPQGWLANHNIAP